MGTSTTATRILLLLSEFLTFRVDQVLTWMLLSLDRWSHGTTLGHLLDRTRISLTNSDLPSAPILHGLSIVRLGGYATLLQDLVVLLVGHHTAHMVLVSKLV